jgi:NAD(P)H-hydrate epimerase
MENACYGTEVGFETESGMTVPAVTAEQMREIDRIAVQETGPNLWQMMENAGRNVASLSLELLGPGPQSAKVLVLAGSGGNGGGGICAARHLANRRLSVGLCLAEPAKLAEVTALQRRTYRFAGGTEITTDALNDFCPDLIIDALIGYSLQSAPRGRFIELIRWANGSGTQILALDLPSGLNPTTGQSPGEMIRAKWTLTLALPKTGLLPGRAGTLFLGDIGIPAETYRRAGLSYNSPFGSRFWIPLRAQMRSR